MTNQILNQAKENENIPINIENIPVDVQEAILSVAVGQTIKGIGNNYSLHVDKMGELLDETGLVMIGSTHPKNYIKNLERRLSVDYDTAKKIATDINEQVFRPIRESLKKIHNIGDQEMEVQSSTEGGVVQVKKPVGVEESRPETTEVKFGQKKSQAAGYVPETKLEEAPLLRLKKEPLPTGEDVEQPFAPLQTYAEEPSVEEKADRPFFKMTPEDTLRATSYTPQAQQKWTPEPPEKRAPAPENLPIETAEQNLPALIPENSIEEKLARPFKIPRAETEYTQTLPPKPREPQKYGGGDPYRERIG